MLRMMAPTTPDRASLRQRCHFRLSEGAALLTPFSMHNKDGVDFVGPVDAFESHRAGQITLVTGKQLRPFPTSRSSVMPSSPSSPFLSSTKGNEIDCENDGLSPPFLTTSSNLVENSPRSDSPSSTSSSSRPTSNPATSFSREMPTPTSLSSASHPGATASSASPLTPSLYPQASLTAPRRTAPRGALSKSVDHHLFREGDDELFQRKSVVETPMTETPKKEISLRWRKENSHSRDDVESTSPNPEIPMSQKMPPRKRKRSVSEATTTAHYGTKPGHFEISIIHFPTSE